MFRIDERQQTVVSHDLPADVEATLTQALAEANDRTDDPETVRKLLDTVRRVATNKLPEGTLREQLLFGCDRARSALDDDDRVAASEYIAAMQRRIE